MTKIDGMGQNEMIKCFGCGEEKAGYNLEHCGYCEHWQAVLDRLTAYEDTEIEPENIIDGKEQTEIACALKLLKTYQALGTVEELSSLVQARKEGRVVVLPCNVGDTVYLTARGLLEETKVRTFFVGHPSYNRGEPDPGIEMIRLTNFDVPLKYFGKTVFLTREEAKKALEEAQSSDKG